MKKSIILLSLVILFSCTNSKNIRLKPENVQIEKIDSSFLRPFNLTAVNNLLLLMAESEKGIIHLYDPIKQRTVFEGFATGRGPDEMLGPSSVQIRQNGNVWIYDVVTRYFNHFNLSSDSLKFTDKIKMDLRIMSAYFISDTTIIALNLIEGNKGWVLLLDKNGNYKKSIVDYPANNDDLPAPVFTESYQGRLSVKPDLQKFVIACRYADRLSIYDIKNNHISTFRSDYPFEPTITVTQTPDFYIMGQSDETKIGFPEISVSNDFVFALFSGKSRKTANPTFSDKVYQLTWTGELVNIYETDLSITDLCWSEFHNCLYVCATDNNNFYLGKLVLSKNRYGPSKPLASPLVTSKVTSKLTNRLA